MTIDTDEQAIRTLISTWARATKDENIDQIRPLMADDVVFLTPGNAPMRGREAFVSGFQQALKQVRIEPSAEVQEIRVMGEWAYTWNQLTVVMTPRSGGAPVRRTGPTLTIFQKQSNGAWVIFRDANMLAEPQR